MKSKLFIGLLLIFGLMVSSTSTAQVILKGGEYFGFAGNYEYRDEADGLFELFVWGTEGEFEGELKYKSLFASYKLSCTVKYKETEFGGHNIYIYFDKEISGKFPQKSEFNTKKEKSGKPVLLFLIGFHRNAEKKSEMVTVFGDIHVPGQEAGTSRSNIFRKLESEGDEGPP
jgi:hypothetical protein